MSDSSSGYRWWEFYFVRYLVGTIVGGIIFFFVCASNPPLDRLLLGATFQQLDMSLLPVFGLYGLAFCYLSSAPILVMHACRFTLRVAPTIGRKTVLALLLPSFGFFCLLNCFWNPMPILWVLVALAAFLVWWLQVLLIGAAFWDTDSLLDFYKSLANARSQHAAGGLVESYRHLREHGNSFMILVFEMILGLTIYVFTASGPAFGGYLHVESVVSRLAIILLVWILPAASVWLVATAMERKFSGWSGEAPGA